MARVTRRKFIQQSAAASTAFGLFTIAGTKASGRVLGANDAVRVGVAGIRGRASSTRFDGGSAEAVALRLAAAGCAQRSSSGSLSGLPSQSFASGRPSLRVVITGQALASSAFSATNCSCPAGTSSSG